MSGATTQPLIPEPKWQVIFAGQNITADVLGSVNRIHYDECSGGKANSLEVRVEDSRFRWQTRFFAEKEQGATVSLSIGYRGSPLVSAGTFQVDEYGVEGPPDVFLFRCVQAPIKQKLRTRNSAGFEGQTLTSIARTVAARFGMTVVASAVQPDVPFARITQSHEMDLAFLHRLAEAHNYEFNIRNNQLVFYSRPALEAQSTTASITRAQLSRYRLIDQTLGARTYSACQVCYLDPDSKQLVSGVATDPSVPTADRLKIIERSENGQQASLKAAGHLHRHNKKKCTAEIYLPGTMQYRAGQMVAISGFGVLDANLYLVEKAKHILDDSGYETALSLTTKIEQKGGGGVQDLVSDEET